MMQKYEPEEYHKNFIQKLNVENSQRIISVFIVIILFSAVQFILYILGDREFYGWQLISIKFSIIILCSFLLVLLHQLKNENAYFTAYSQQIIHLCVISIILISIVNTFFAQRISSDISIYIMAIFAVAAGVRMKPVQMFWILLFTYIIFTFGIGVFQPNPIYRLSHIVNGSIMNIIAFIISDMFFHYSLEEYNHKIDMDTKNQELKNFSERDCLTNLYNNRALNSILEKAFEEGKVKYKEIYLGMLDLDNFKEINDRYGHPFGDEILKKIADIINSNIRSVDIAGRYGGDEFILIFKGTTGEQVSRIMNRLLEEVRNLNYNDLKLSFSCGVAKWNGESKEKLFERADHFMYKVKKSGKNNVLVEMPEDINGEYFK